MTLNELLDELVHQEGADFFGVADLSHAYDTILEQGGTEVASYPRAISIGIALMDSIIDQLPQAFERAVAVSYRHHYDITNLRLDLLAARVASTLQKEGHKSLPIPASKRSEDHPIKAVFSHKLAANLAGLGWIGKSCLLITPEAGPRVRWVTVLTNAPLSVTGPAMEESCGDCAECVDACPVGAFTGEPFREGEPREVRYDAAKCEKYHYEEQKEEWTVCGLCIYSCPRGF
ncbi:MAG TPA: 4Fe-4S double cluster binding domain-containing protein [Methanobacteriaceae archaeon]|nr:4Fe-4S double cluster binding domain-containing protein [Methanobacteriaceae archaeon]